jgi:hypothetical protein
MFNTQIPEREKRGADSGAATGSTIRAAATRKADGWYPTLEYAHGGRVIGAIQCGTLVEAVYESENMIQCMADYPVAFRSNHPAPNQLIDLSTEMTDGASNQNFGRKRPNAPAHCAGPDGSAFGPAHGSAHVSRELRISVDGYITLGSLKQGAITIKIPDTAVIRCADESGWRGIKHWSYCRDTNELSLWFVVNPTNDQAQERREGKL